METSRIEQRAADSAFDGGSDKQGSQWVGSVVAAALPLVLLAFLPASESNVRAEPARLDIKFEDNRYAPLFGNRLNGWRPKVRNPDLVFAQTMFDRQSVGGDSGPDESLFVGVYGYEHQRHRAELIQYWNKLYDRDEWVPERFFSVRSPGGVRLQGLTLKSPGTARSVHIAYAYYVEGVWETDQLRAKLAQVAGFFNARTDASLMVFGVACEECNGEDAVTTLVENTMPAIVQQVDQRFVD